MGATINYNFPIYDDDWPPDLTSTGAEAQAIIDIDTELKKQETQESEDASRLNQLIQDERTERTDADTALQTNIGKETEERKAADSELKSSVENVENELTGVSADVTGVFGLTYGDDNVNFIEKSGDTYSSPALVEIQHQIADASAAPAWDTVTDKPFETLGEGLSVSDGVLSASGGSTVNSIAPLTVETAPTAQNNGFAAGPETKANKNAVAIGYAASAGYTGNVAIGYKSTVSDAAGVSIGSTSSAGLNSVSAGAGCKAASNSISIGASAKANSTNDVVIGGFANTSYEQATIIGYAANTSARYTVALGCGASCSKEDSVALGYKSSALTTYEVSLGSGTAGVSTEVTRRVTHVTAPTASTDAANKQYVDDSAAAISAQAITKSTYWSDVES